MKKINIWRRTMERKIVEFLLLKKGIQKIAHELRIGKGRIRDVRNKAIRAGYLSGLTPLPAYPLPLFPDELDRRSLRSSPPDQALQDMIPWIRECLSAFWKPITIYEELKMPEISRSSFYRFLERHELSQTGEENAGVTGPILHEPGEALQLDWGKLRDVKDSKTQKKKTLWAFVGVLGFSRYMIIRLVWTNDVSTTLDSIELMLKELGGVPKKVTSDNPKCFSLKADRYDPILNPALIRFSDYYNFVMECLPPREPKKKGKVERLMPFARRIFEAYPEEWVSLDHAQKYMDEKVALANQRIHGTTRLKPLVVFFEKEASKLKPLPSIAYEKEEISYPEVRRDGFVRVVNKYYAVSDIYTGKETIVLTTKKQVSIYCESKLLEVYSRITDPYQTHEMKEYLKKPWQKTLETNAHYLSQAKKIGSSTEAFILSVLQRGNGFVDTRIIWGVLSLSKKYSAEQVNRAAQIGLDLNQLSSRFVEKMIQLHKHPDELSKSSSTTPTAISTTNKFIRPMSVYSEKTKVFH